jgi:CRISPR-associated protein Cmr2
MVNQKDIKLRSAEILLGVTWCLAYAPGSSNNQATLQALRQHFYHDQPCRDDLAEIVAAVRSLSGLTHPKTLPELQQYIADHPTLWQNKIGVVYGGATKIKPYVFDVPKLHEIRGASALLDNINLVDLPAFFHADNSAEKRFKACRSAEVNYCESVRTWLIEEGYGELREGLIHELIIYSTGGNILAFCPQELVMPLADAIEKRYTTETLVANSCAVGKTYTANLEFMRYSNSNV